MDAGTRTARRFREGWSLAAGTGLRARVSGFAVAAALALPLGVIRRVTSAPNGDVHVFQPFVAVLPAVLAAWISWSIAGRPWRRSAGERRRRDRGGERWWLDRAWPASGATRWMATGIAGSSVASAFTLAATFALCASSCAYATRNPGYYRKYIDEAIGPIPVSPAVAIAVWALPLVWLLIVLVPRIGRGRLLVAWPSFPQRTGGRCAFHVGTSPGGARIDSVRVFLRCIRTPSRPFLPLATWNARLLWVGEARLPLGAYAGPQRHLVAMFDVPAEAPPTDLHAKDAVRWEVLVLGTVGGADYADSVIVPVYAN